MTKPPMYDLTGQTFTRWFVIERAAIATGTARFMWLCRCDCGTVRPVNQRSLISGKSQSCGCLAHELSAQRHHPGTRQAYTHGMSYTTEYKTYWNMKTRCENPNNKDYPRYGGRGIVVDLRWDTFEQFLSD